MENVIIQELGADLKKITNFLVFLKKKKKKEAQLALVVDDYNKECAVHRFLIKIEDILKVEWEKNFTLLKNLQKKKKMILFFLFIYDFYDFTKKYYHYVDLEDH